MGKTKNSLSVKLILAAAIAAVIVAVVLIVVLSGKHDSAEVKEGVAYIKNAEAMDVADVENEIYAAKKEAMLAEIDTKMAEDPDYVWTALSNINTVFMGDSRTVSYLTYGFVDSSRCLGDGAKSIRVIPDHYEELKVANPKLIVLAYGLNDVGWFWTDVKDYAAELMGYVDAIHEFLPDCTIYIQSTILPREGVDDIFDNPGLYERVREWNTEALEIYKENGYLTIDIGDLVEEHADLFLSDGIHMEAEFYPLLATAILKQYLSDTMDAEK